MTIKGGKAGKIKRLLDLTNTIIFGAGGYGIVIKDKKEVYKLFIELDACKLVKNEVIIQEKAYKLFNSNNIPIGIPKITYYSNDIVKYRNKSYLCGIGMEFLKPPLDFEESVHILLGYKHDDIDTSWGQTYSKEVSNTNPTRGFFASPDTMEYIWKNENSIMTIEKLAFLMGQSLRLLIDNGILPIDIEWIWSNGKPWIIDFGLCELGNVDPLTFLKKSGLCGLASDYYIPHIGDRGYNEFISGFGF